MSAQNAASSQAQYALRYVRTAGVTLLVAFLALVLVPPDYLRVQKQVYDALTVVSAMWVLVGTGLVLSKGRKACNILVPLFAFFIGAPLLLTYLGFRWIPFVRVPANVHVGQQQVEGARLYKGIHGEMLIALNASSMHLYLPKQKEVMLCDAYLFHNYFLFGRLEKGKDEYFCMSSEKQEITLDLQVKGRSIAFNVPSGRSLQRVVVNP